jgi:hypothetical protein
MPYCAIDETNREDHLEGEKGKTETEEGQIDRENLTEMPLEKHGCKVSPEKQNALGRSRARSRSPVDRSLAPVTKWTHGIDRPFQYTFL